MRMQKAPYDQEVVTAMLLGTKSIRLRARALHPYDSRPTTSDAMKHDCEGWERQSICSLQANP